MYKFTNGIVVFDEKTRDNYLKAGFVLEKEAKKEIKEEPVIEGQINIDEAIEEETNEDKQDNPIVDRKPKSSNKISK